MENEEKFDLSEELLKLEEKYHFKEDKALSEVQGGTRVASENSSQTLTSCEDGQGGKGGHLSIENLSLLTNHLPCFENIRDLTHLIGDTYIPILKPIYYSLLSTRIPKMMIKLGEINTDCRLHVLVPLISGGGKNQIKSMVRKVLNGKEIGEPTSLHSEQLIGKTKVKEVNKNDTYIQFPGFFSQDVFLLDESYTLLKSNELIYTESRKYLRDALDPYGLNLITKKSVDVPFGQHLSYFPHFVCIAFVQPLELSYMRVYEGDTRRFLIPFVDLQRVDRRAALKNRIRKIGTTEESFRDFYNTLPTEANFIFTGEIADSLVYHSELLIDYGFSLNDKIAHYTNYKQFTIQELLLKMASLLTYAHKKEVTGQEEMEMAYCDLFEILVCEFEYIDRHITGNLDYGTSVRGAEWKDEECLRWLCAQDAISEEKTTVTIKQYEETVCKIFRVQERQVRRLIEEQERKGWIEKKQHEQYSSKVWLKFKPEFFKPRAYHTGCEAYKTYKYILGKHGHPDHPEKVTLNSVLPDNNDLSPLDHPEKSQFNEPNPLPFLDDARE